MPGQEINWEKTMSTALQKAQNRDIPVFIFFHDPNCIGCQQMKKITLVDERVIDFLNENTIPLMLSHDVKPWASDYNIKWTPTFLVMDSKGREHHRLVGFLSPEDFIPDVMLGIDKIYFDNDKLDDAIVNLDKLVDAYPDSEIVPEAIYLKGVSLFKKTNDVQPLKDVYQKLNTAFPESEWAKRANPYRLL